LRHRRRGLRLESRGDRTSLQLALSFEHPDVNERVVYALPVCER
jgi:hypothetical protein